MFKLTILLAFIAYTQAGIVAPVVHPVVAHPVVHSVHPVVHPVVHHAAPIVHAPTVSRYNYKQPHNHTTTKMFKLTILLAFIAYTQAGIVAPVVHPVVAHPVVHSVHPVVHPVVHHAAPIVHAPVVHAAPIVPIVKHAPVIAVHH